MHTGRKGKSNMRKECPVSDNEVVSHFEKQLERTNHWLAFAEAKNGALIAVNVALLAAVMSVFDKAPVFCVAASSCFLLSCVLSLLSFFPNMGKNVSEKNLLFYGDISEIGTTEEYMEQNGERYFSGEKTVQAHRLAYDLASEVIINSRITVKKYNWFKKAVKMDFLALFMTFIFLVAA